MSKEKRWTDRKMGSVTNTPRINKKPINISKQSFTSTVIKQMRTERMNWFLYQIEIFLFNAKTQKLAKVRERASHTQLVGI